jgi:hypothetical protein
MSRFWKRHQSDPVETLLQANRPQPSDEYIASQLARLETRPRRSHVGVRLGARVLVAAGITALALGAALAAGGISSAADGVHGLVNVAKLSVGDQPQDKSKPNKDESTTTENTPTTTQDSSTTTTDTTSTGQDTSTTTTTLGTAAPIVDNNSGPADDNSQNESAGDHQYAIEICHHTSSATNPWVDLFLSPQGAANHLANHTGPPPDFLVTPNTPCPPA